ncbi:MAG: efflux RND transporter periplasmic adaptor subunit [Alphaproteobacteria bacterium]|nr:efflux RND transporter periplasmic adaptor subunit [Alphaproteobacteria bacterium]
MRFSVLLAAVALLPTVATATAGDAVVHKQMIDDQKAVIGTIESVRSVEARARISGTIGSLLVKEGDQVKTGDKIAVIGDVKLAIRGRGLEAQQQAALSAYEKAKLDYGRAEELRRTGYGTQAKLDEARSALEIAQNNLQAAGAGRQEIQQQSAEGTVTAPNAGRILKIPVAVGSVVMPGETIATLSQEDYILRVQLPERHAKSIRAGDAIQLGGRGLQEEGLSTKMQTGTVRLVYPEIKDGRVIADISVPNLGDYFVGERTRVYISTGKRPAYLVPSAAITKRSGVAFVRLKGGSEIVVQPGQHIDDQTEILAGLNENDVVVTP